MPRSASKRWSSVRRGHSGCRRCRRSRPSSAPRGRASERLRAPASGRRGRSARGVCSSSSSLSRSNFRCYTAGRPSPSPKLRSSAISPPCRQNQRLGRCSQHRRRRSCRSSRLCLRRRRRLHRRCSLPPPPGKGSRCHPQWARRAPIARTSGHRRRGLSLIQLGKTRTTPSQPPPPPPSPYRPKRRPPPRRPGTQQ